MVNSFPLVLRVRVIFVKQTEAQYKYKFRVEKVLKGDKNMRGKLVSKLLNHMRIWFVVVYNVHVRARSFLFCASIFVL